MPSRGLRGYRTVTAKTSYSGSSQSSLNSFMTSSKNACASLSSSSPTSCWGLPSLGLFFPFFSFLFFDRFFLAPSSITSASSSAFVFRLMGGEGRSRSSNPVGLRKPRESGCGGRVAETSSSTWRTRNLCLPSLRGCADSSSVVSSMTGGYSKGYG